MTLIDFHVGLALIKQTLGVMTFHANSVHGNRDMSERSLYNTTSRSIWCTGLEAISQEQ